MHERVRQELLRLAHSIADRREMSILGEGNVSGSIGGSRFLVKASGTQMPALRPEHVVEVDGAPVLGALRRRDSMTDDEVERLLLDARVDPKSLKPSVETLFHAWFLSLPGVTFVGHVHAVAVNQILASPRARDFARRRVIPDQVVYCGAESPLVPYVDPGFPLALRIRDDVQAFRERTGSLPKTILMENHGIIAVGPDRATVAAALSMAEKAARIFVGAAALGGPVFMDERQVRRIAGRSDEHYRQRMLREAGQGAGIA